MKKQQLIRLQAIAFSLLFINISCQKKGFQENKQLDQTAVTNGKVNASVATTTAARQLIASSFDPSGRLEMKIWAEYVSGNVNHVEVSVDPDFVLVGGGARVTNNSNTETGVNALLTASYPKNDQTFSTFVAESKDHWSPYNHRLWVYAIGMKLYNSSGQAIPAATVKPHLNITMATDNGYGRRPDAYAETPAGYYFMSGGARVLYNNPGLLLVYNSGANITGAPGTGGWYAIAKDHVVEATGNIEAYVLSFDNNIPEFGTMLFRSKFEYPPSYDHVVTANLSCDWDNSGYLLTSVGGWAHWEENPVGAHFGRLLYATYPVDLKVGRVGTKDHHTADTEAGFMMIAVTGIKRQ
jgi:hypothetical protein